MATSQMYKERATLNQSIRRPGHLAAAWCIALCALWVVAYPGAAMTMQEDKLIKLRLDDVHPLHGGQNMVISSDGTAMTQVVTWRKDLSKLHEVRYKTSMSPEVMGDLTKLSNAAADSEGPSPRAGLPDEPRPTISATFQSQKSFRLLKWANDQYPKFDRIYAVLLGQIEKARNTTPVYEGPYDPRGLMD